MITTCSHALSAILGRYRSSLLEEACRLLNPEQKLYLALNLLDAALAQGVVRPGDHPCFMQILEGLGLTADQLQPYWRPLAIKNDLGLFPQ